MRELGVDVHRQIELRGRALEIELVDLQAEQLRLAHRRIQHVEEHAHRAFGTQRAVVSQRIDQLVEGRLLVRIGLERVPAHAVHELREARVAREVGAHHQRVDQRADQMLRGEAMPVRDRHADRDVVALGLPRQHQHEGRQVDHERRDGLAATEFAHRLAQPRRQLGRDARALGAGLCRTREIGGQVELRQVAQAFEPVRQVRAPRLDRFGPALPGGVVGIGNRGRRRFRPATGRQGAVRRQRFAHQQRAGPVIGDRVVQQPEQHMLAFAEPDQGRPVQRRLREIEGLRNAIRQQRAPARCPRGRADRSGR